MVNRWPLTLVFGSLALVFSGCTADSNKGAPHEEPDAQATYLPPQGAGTTSATRLHLHSG